MFESNKSNIYPPFFDELSENEKQIWEDIYGEEKQISNREKYYIAEQNTQLILKQAILNSSKPLPILNKTNHDTYSNHDLNINDISKVNHSIRKIITNNKIKHSLVTDLHNLKLEEAFLKTVETIEYAYYNQLQKIMIITGKSKKTKETDDFFEKIETQSIKEAIPTWLNHQSIANKILCVTNAKYNQGGSGALTIIIKKYNPSR